MRALVTNDDGVDSAGLRALADAASAHGMEVTVVAPSYDASGSSASMTAVADAGRVIVERVAWDDSDARVFGVHGPPAFIVRAAIYGAFGPEPDVVLAGVNQGLNTGRSVLHSGTVGAALTAAIHGRRALALSAEVHDVYRDPPRSITSAALQWLTGCPDHTVLNVNVPAGTDSRNLEVRATHLAASGMVQGRVTEVGGELVSVIFSDQDGPPQPGTDVAALAEGFVSVTAIRAVTEDDRVDLGRLLDRRRPGT